MPAIDWPSIGYDGPPITGEPGTVATLGSNLTTVADTIDDQLSQLTGVDAAEIWDSEAAIGFREASAELPDLLGKVSTRYREAGGVIETYATALEDAVGDMEWWGCAAVEARATLDAASRNLETQRGYEQEAQEAVERWNRENPDQPTVAPASTLGVYEQAVTDAQEDLDRALDNIEDAVAAKNAAGDQAAEALADVNDDDLRNSWNPFRSVGQWLSRTLDLPAWADLLRTITSVVSIAALLLCWVPVIGPILGAVALVLNVVMLLVDLCLVASGEGSWTNVAFDAIGVLTGGFGRAASVGARAAGQGYRAARGGPALARFAPARSSVAHAWTHARNPFANFGEVGEHLSIVRAGRPVPAALGGHSPGYWNAFTANARTHGRNLIGQGGPTAAAWAWGDVTRRMFFPTGNTPNPIHNFDQFQSHHELDRATDHAGTIDPTPPYDDAPPPPDPDPDCRDCDTDLPEPDRPDWQPEPPQDQAPEPPYEPEPPADQAPEPSCEPEPPQDQVPEPPQDQVPEPPCEPDPPQDQVPEPPQDQVPEPPCEPEPPVDRVPGPSCEPMSPVDQAPSGGSSLPSDQMPSPASAGEPVAAGLAEPRQEPVLAGLGTAPGGGPERVTEAVGGDRPVLAAETDDFRTDLPQERSGEQTGRDAGDPGAVEGRSLLEAVGVGGATAVAVLGVGAHWGGLREQRKEREKVLADARRDGAAESEG